VSEVQRNHYPKTTFRTSIIRRY